MLISYNSCVTWLLTSNFNSCFFFSYLHGWPKALILRSKRSLTIKQVLIFSETKMEKMEKYIHRKTPVMMSFLVQLQVYRKGTPSEMFFVNFYIILFLQKTAAGWSAVLGYTGRTGIYWDFSWYWDLYSEFGKL